VFETTVLDVRFTMPPFDPDPHVVVPSLNAPRMLPVLYWVVEPDAVTAPVASMEIAFRATLLLRVLEIPATPGMESYPATRMAVPSRLRVICPSDVAVPLKVNWFTPDVGRAVALMRVPVVEY
jgi:hypothetical protein